MSSGRGGSEFGICFELGRALRRGDVEAFFTVYDKLIPKNAQIEGVKETARLISELSWSEYSLVEDAFVDPNTPVAKRNIDFHSSLTSQLENIVHEIRGDLYHEDSGTLSDMDSSSSETTITLDEEKPNVPDKNMTDNFSGIEVGGFAIACESDVGNKEGTAKGNDYMYEIGTKFSEPRFTALQENSKNRSNEIMTSTLPQETATGSGTSAVTQKNTGSAAIKVDSTEEPTVLPSSPRQARPSSAPTLRSFQQRKSSHIQLKSFSTTRLVPRQSPTATMQRQVRQYHSHAAMSEEFPRWLYSEVVKAGLQFCKPSFIRLPSSSISSDSDSDSINEESIADSTDEQPMQVSTDQQSTKLSTDQQSTIKTSIVQLSTKSPTYQQAAQASNDQQPMEMSIDQQPAAMNTPVSSPLPGMYQSRLPTTPKNNTKSNTQFDHYGAICYLWREWKDTLKNC